MPEFITNADKVNRSITLPEPEVLQCDSLKKLVSMVGEDLVKHQTEAQIRIKARSLIRNKLEATKEDGSPAYTDNQITKEWDVEWVPELRIQKTPEEKAMEALGALDPETRKAVLAAMAKAA